jgi:hypothetical protein
MLHCNCSFNICVASFIIHKQHVKEECMQTWKIRISWNIKQNSISGAFVFDCTIWFRIFHLDHFQLLLNGYRAKLLMERKLSGKDDRSASPHSRLWNEFFHYDFVLQEAGNARSRELEPWRKMDADCSFDLRGETVWFRRKLCVVQLFSTLSTLLWWMFSSFQIFNFFQPFSTFFNLFQPFSTLFLNFKLWEIVLEFFAQIWI